MQQQPRIIYKNISQAFSRRARQKRSFIGQAVSGLFFVLLAGCATSRTASKFNEAPMPELQSDMAVLYIFRSYAEPTAFAAHAEIDQLEVVSLNQEGFSWVYIKPGEHSFKIRWSSLSGMPDLEFKKSLEAGKVYAFQILGSVKELTPNATTNSSLSHVKIEVAKEKRKACCSYVQSRYKRN